jgi:hypothetical protein
VRRVLFDTNVISVTGAVEHLANNYTFVYREVGGMLAHDKLNNDFTIVASATLRGMDIVVSDDNNSMLNKYSLKAYGIVNTLNNKRTPRFISYDTLKKELSKRWKP